MDRVRALIILGLLASGPGCAALQSRGLTAHPDGGRSSPSAPPSLAESGAKAPDVEDDPFHAKPTTPVARLSRYFPGLTRPDASSAPSPGLLRRGTRGPKDSDRALEAVPRPGPSPSDEETTTASLPSWRGWGRASAKKKAAATDRTDPATRTASARGAEAVEAAAPPPPLLAAALVAEVDPDPPAGERVVASLPPVSGRRPVPGAPGSSALPISVRRSPPPLPAITPTARRPLPPRSPSYDRPEAVTAGRRPAAHDADDQAKQAAAVPEEPEARAPAPDPSPHLAVSEPPVEEEQPESPAPADRPVADSPPALDPPSVDPSSLVDSPPPIGGARPGRPVDKDAGGDPTLVGRPRMSNPPATRISPRAGLPDDLPPPLFPRSYYGEKAPKPAPDPMISAEDAPKRWTWTPRILKALRGH